MVNPAVKTEPTLRETTAIRIRTTPQTAVSQRESRSRLSSLAFGAISGLYKSSVVVEASELREPLRFDIAAAKTAAITRPDTPCGRRSTMNVGKIWSLLVSVAASGKNL